MGTRAVVKKNGKFLFATHYDGDPKSLGKELLDAVQKTEDIDNSIEKVAEAHTIDSKDELSYGDWADFEYDVREGEVYVRECSGPYQSKDRKCGQWVKVNYDG